MSAPIPPIALQNLPEEKQSVVAASMATTTGFITGQLTGMLTGAVIYGAAGAIIGSVGTTIEGLASAGFSGLDIGEIGANTGYYAITGAAGGAALHGTIGAAAGAIAGFNNTMPNNETARIQEKAVVLAQGIALGAASEKAESAIHTQKVAEAVRWQERVGRMTPTEEFTKLIESQNAAKPAAHQK